MKEIESIAIINPMADFGIDGYTHQLAEGLVANGLTVDVYVPNVTELELNDLPRQHRRVPVLGSALLKQRRALAARAGVPSQVTRTITAQICSPPSPSRLRRALRRQFLPVELAAYLRWRGYDLVWTQWPEMEDYGSAFWRVLKMFGLRVVHTVHNVLPHEAGPHSLSNYAEIYRYADVLVVHSQCSRRELLRRFPDLDDKVIVMKMGTYTIYPRNPQARPVVRRELKVGDDEPVVLFCGGIRPYKNVDSVLAALASPICPRVVLVIAGVESGYPGPASGDPLGRSRRLADQFGVTDRVRFIPGDLSLIEMADLFEGGDIVALPYLEGYGSAMLRLGMTFGKHILSTPVGGAVEYLSDYSRATLLEGSEPEHVAHGLAEAVKMVLEEPARVERPNRELEWPVVAARCISSMAGRLGCMRPGFVDPHEPASKPLPPSG